MTIAPLGPEIARTSPNPLPVVYALVDEREPNRVRYIGSSFDPGGRLYAHGKQGTGPIRAWMADVAKNGACVLQRWIAFGENRAHAYQIEEAHIVHYQAMGQADLNVQTACRRRIAL